MILNGNGPALSAVCVTLSVISVLLVLLRCYVRVYLVRAFRYDDWLLIVALVSNGEAEFRCNANQSLVVFYSAICVRDVSSPLWARGVRLDIEHPPQNSQYTDDNSV